MGKVCYNKLRLCAQIKNEFEPDYFLELLNSSEIFPNCKFTCNYMTSNCDYYRCYYIFETNMNDFTNIKNNLQNYCNNLFNEVSIKISILSDDTYDRLLGSIENTENIKTFYLHISASYYNYEYPDY